MKLRPAIQFLALAFAIGWLFFATFLTNRMAGLFWEELLPGAALPSATILTQSVSPYVLGSGVFLSLVGLLLAFRSTVQARHLDILFAAISILTLVFMGVYVLAAFLPTIKMTVSVSP